MKKGPRWQQEANTRRKRAPRGANLSPLGDILGSPGRILETIFHAFRASGTILKLGSFLKHLRCKKHEKTRANIRFSINPERPQYKKHEKTRVKMRCPRNLKTTPIQKTRENTYKNTIFHKSATPFWSELRRDNCPCLSPRAQFRMSERRFATE